MSVVIETTLGDITVDLYLSDRPRTSLNFLKLCAVKYYNYNLFHTISRGFIAQTGDPTGSRSGGESIYGVLEGSQKRYFEAESEPRIKHTKMGLISFVGNKDRMIGSQFFITLGENLTYLDEKHCVFGEVVEGFDVLEVINEVICDSDDRPYQDVRITHTVILDDPFPQPKWLIIPSRSPSPCVERLQGGRIAPDEEIDETEGKTVEEVSEMQAEQEAKARATILEMVGDIPDADMAPPENVLFVCKLNPVTTDDDLEIIFNRFGKIKSCEVIRDRKTGDSLQYAFIEFEEQKSCEDAYFKMDNILIDDRRIHVDFSQSVSKVKWLGKGRGVAHYDERGEKTNIRDSNIGKGKYNSNEKSDYPEQCSDNSKHKVQNNSSRSTDKYDRSVTQSHHQNFENRDRNRSRSKTDNKSNARCHKPREYYPEYGKKSVSTSGCSDRNDQSYSTHETKKTFRSINNEKNYSKQKGHYSSYELDDDKKSNKKRDVEKVVKKKHTSKGKYSSDYSDSEHYNKKPYSSELYPNHKDSKEKYGHTQMDRKKTKSERKDSLDGSDSEVEQKNKQSIKTYNIKLDKKYKDKKQSCSKDTSSSDSDYRKTNKRKLSKRRKH